MKMKRIRSFMLFVIMVLSILTGCIAQASVSTDPSAAGEPAQLTELSQTLSSAARSSGLLEGFEPFAEELGLSTDNLNKKTVSGVEMAEILDKLVGYAAPKKLAGWKSKNPGLRKSVVPLKRYDMILALYLALKTIGGNYAYVNYDFDFNRPEWWALDGDYSPTWELFDNLPLHKIPNFGEDHDGSIAWFFNISRTSPVDGKYPAEFDYDTNSFHQNDRATYSDAVLAVLRIVSIVEYKYPPADTINSYIITDKLIAKAKANPVVTSEDHPRWTGFTLGLGEPGIFGTSPHDIELAAEWGFNSVRVMLHYRTLFSDDNARKADLVAFTELDRLVAAAIENDVHLNILLLALPGRNANGGDTSTGFVSTADLDLFVNPTKQKQALSIYRILAKRYKDIPNFNLSLTPFWEALNHSLSTGLPAPDYSAKEVAAFLGKAIDAIREEDPDRLIIYEPTAINEYYPVIEESRPTKAVADSKGNVMISYNACEPAYIYACMTDTEGSHIDNMNHSLDLQPYPNYIYSIINHISHDASITLDGCLPAGTVLDLYVSKSYGGTLNISADGVSLYSEKLPERQYKTGDHLSRYYPYAQSDKHISVALSGDTKELVLSCEDGWLDICGICLTLPDKYAKERWYYVQQYDVFLGLEEKEGVALRTSSAVILAPNNYEEGRKITIHDDLTYTSESIWAEASTATVNKFAEEINKFDGNCVIRFERATFGGTIWSEQKEYYEDLLKSYEEYGFSWWSNDWLEIINDFSQIAESTYIEYAGYDTFHLELLQLLQKYQSKNKPAIPYDLDGNGVVNALDALVILRAAVNGEKLDPKIADVNNDGMVNASDASALLKIVIGL